MRIRLSVSHAGMMDDGVRLEDGVGGVLDLGIRHGGNAAERFGGGDMCVVLICGY